MKFNRLSDQRNTLVFTLIVKQPYKPFRLPKHPHWYNSNIQTHHSARLISVPENSGASGNEIADEFTRDGSAQQFAGPLATLEISRQNIMHIMCWLFNQHMTLQQSYQHLDRQSE
jgi:hypothetical protein